MLKIFLAWLHYRQILISTQRWFYFPSLRFLLLSIYNFAMIYSEFSSSFVSSIPILTYFFPWVPIVQFFFCIYLLDPIYPHISYIYIPFIFKLPCFVYFSFLDVEKDIFIFQCLLFERVFHFNLLCNIFLYDLLNFNSIVFTLHIYSSMVLTFCISNSFLV